MLHDELKRETLDAVNREYRGWISYREVFRSEKVVVGGYEGSFPKADLRLFIFSAGISV